jgi:hypothetical protein
MCLCVLYSFITIQRVKYHAISDFRARASISNPNIIILATPTTTTTTREEQARSSGPVWCDRQTDYQEITSRYIILHNEKRNTLQ